MSNASYSDETKDKFVALAGEVGVEKARKELGYPSYNTAMKWCTQRGIKPPTEPALSLAGSVQNAQRIDRSMKEILLNVKEHYDVQVQKAVLDEDSLTLKRLTEGLKILNETLRNVYGEAGEAIEKASSIDSGFMELVKEMNRKNEGKPMPTE